MINYLNKWKETTKSKYSTFNNINEIDKSETTKDSDYLINNRKVIESCINSDYLTINRPSEYNLPKSVSVNYKYKTDKIDKLIIILKDVLRNRTKEYFSYFIYYTRDHINRRKAANSNLTLLYLFTQITITKHQLEKQWNKKDDNRFEEAKILELEKKIKKLEACLTEKAEIIAGKNDKIDFLFEQNELSADKITKLENKLNSLNSIQGKQLLSFKVIIFRKSLF
jgi:hypothetical protein